MKLFQIRVVHILSIEGNPFIIRFKTNIDIDISTQTGVPRIEGNPFIIRFKTL